MENFKVLHPLEGEDYETAVMELQRHPKFQNMSVGILSDSAETTHIIPPHVIKVWVENGVQVYLQRNYGSKAQYSNMDYAEIGAEIIDNPGSIIRISQIIIKHSFLSEEEYLAITKSKIVISEANPSLATSEWAHHCYREHLSFFGMNLMQSAAENWALNHYFFTNKEGEKQIDYNATISSIVRYLAQSITLRSAIQTTPILLQTIYCFQGQICNREIAEAAGVPWKDISGLCWEWN